MLFNRREQPVGIEKTYIQWRAKEMDYLAKNTVCLIFPKKL